MKNSRSFFLKIATLLLAVLMTAAAASACTPKKTTGKIDKKTETGLLDIGETFTFGRYEQNNDPEAKEEIEWLVIDREDGKALVISVAGLDAVQYNEKGGDTTWETSTARKWLNETFISEAFTQEEAKAILTTTVSGDANSKTKVEGGNDTSDKIFLLSIDEVEMYMDANERKASPTAYAIANGAQASTSKTAYCWWFLRTPGSSTSFVAYVDVNGFISTNGALTQVINNTVRPAFWIDVKAFKVIWDELHKTPTPAPSATPAPEENETATPEEFETVVPDVTEAP